MQKMTGTNSTQVCLPAAGLRFRAELGLSKISTGDFSSYRPWWHGIPGTAGPDPAPAFAAGFSFPSQRHVQWLGQFPLNEFHALSRVCSWVSWSTGAGQGKLISPGHLHSPPSERSCCSDLDLSYRRAVTNPRNHQDTVLIEG